jgi:DNA-binding HxlR family transcriptional regulator
MPLIIRELLCGSHRFSEIQRGVPLISPALLSKRLRQLEAARLIDRTPAGHGSNYTLTDAGWELYPIIEAMGAWGQRWARSKYTADDLDPGLLMWDMRRMLQPAGLAPSRTVVEFRFARAPQGKSTYWLVVEDAIDLCLIDPGHPVDLWVRADLRYLTQVWMGDRTMTEAITTGAVQLDGPRSLTRRFPDWLGQHPVLAKVPAAVKSPA